MAWAALQDWTDELDRNEHGVRILTIAKARAMAARGERLGWYVAPFATKWTVGRMAGKARYYILIDDREPVVFDTIWQAKSFLSKLVGAAAEPKLLWHRFRQAVPRGALPPHRRLAIHAACPLVRALNDAKA